MKFYKLDFSNEEIKSFFQNNLYLSLYSQERRRTKVKKKDLSRIAQEYIFSSAAFESWEIDLYSPPQKFLSTKNKKFKVLFAIDVKSKFLITEIIENKSAKIIKSALEKVFQKINSVQKNLPSIEHIKRIFSGFKI